MKNNNGFTLIEIMIVVAVIAILAGIAIPSYEGHVRKSKRSDAKTALLALQNAQEKFRGSCRFYAGDIDNANPDFCGASSALSTIEFNPASPEGYYTLSISGGSATAYTATATANAGTSQAADGGCTSITLTVNPANPTGLRGPDGCW